MPRARASSAWEISMGSKNSLSSIVPGCVGGRFLGSPTPCVFMSCSFSVVVDNLDIFGSRRSPSKADSVLVVDANGVLAFPIPVECLQSISRWNLERLEIVRLVQRIKFPEGRVPEFNRTDSSGLPGV